MLALVTYTKNNEKEIKRKFYEHVPVIPSRVEVMTWFSLSPSRDGETLSTSAARPADRWSALDGGPVGQIHAESNTAAHYFACGRLIYSDKISKFICECDRLTGGAVMQRLAMRFDHIFVDEIQDMAGYDLDVLELILKTGIKLTLVGDHRQATLRTNQGKKNSAFAGFNIVKKFQQWEKTGLAFCLTSATPTAATSTSQISATAFSPANRRQSP